MEEVEVEVEVAHAERASLRVRRTSLKIDADEARAEAEVRAMAAAPVATAEVLRHRPPVLALAEVRGTALGRYGEPSAAPRAAWRAAGSALRMLHDAPPPPWPAITGPTVAARLEAECAWLVANGVLPADVIARNREVAEAALEPRPEVFVHGDLQPSPVLLDGVRVAGILDWSEAGRGDAVLDLAVLTLGHPTASTTWSRWPLEHGFDPAEPGCEVDVLRAAARAAD